MSSYEALIPHEALPIFLALVPFVLSFIFLKTDSSNKYRLKLPPSPPSLPFLGHLLLLSSLPHRSLASIAARYGSLMLLRLGQVPTLIVSSADAAAHVLKTHDLAFSDRSPLIAGDKFTYGGLDIALAQYGDNWRNLRKLSMMEFFSQKKVDSFSRIRKEEIEFVVAIIAKHSRSSLVNLTELCFTFTCNVLYREVFGKRASGDGEENSQFQDLVIKAMDLISGFQIGDLFPAFKWVGTITGIDAKLDRCAREIDALFEEELEANNGDEGEPCLTRSLLRLQRDPNLGFTLRKEHIKALLLDMFLGGIDTSAVAIEWAMAELMLNQAKLRKAQSEVRRILGNRGFVEEADLDSMTYLKMVVKETLRLHPSVCIPLPRQTRENCMIDGYHVPAGTRVLMNVWAIGRDEKHWENADEFLPERFEDSEVDYAGMHFQFIPFGGGRRICPGIALSVAAVELCLANLLLRFDWEIPEGVVLHMEEVAGLTVRRKTALLLKAVTV